MALGGIMHLPSAHATSCTINIIPPLAISILLKRLPTVTYVNIT